MPHHFPWSASMFNAIPENTLDRGRSRLILAVCVLAGFLGFNAGTGRAHGADAYDAAVAQPGRSKADRERDAIDHPAEVLRLAGIKLGMKVADVLAADGYYSELLSYLVGPKGHVQLINNAAFEKWSE